MGRITTGTGLVSGINSKEIIDQLMQLESRPKTLLQTRVDSTNKQKVALTDLATRLSSIKLFGTTIKKTQTWGAAKTTSSNEDVLTATAAPGASIGSFQFQVARLVTTQQAVSTGFTDPDSARVGAGTLTLEMGGGEVASQTLLSQLRGGQGLSRGIFRITDAAGKTAAIDISSAVTVDDVLKKINTSLDIGVRASISGDSIKLTDTSGGAGTMSVADVGDGRAATDLGLAGVAPVSGVITGADINYLGRSTTLNAINDGRGIRRASSGNDFSISAGGQTYEINLASARTIGDVMDIISTTSNGSVTASIDPGSNALKLSGSGAMTVASLTDSKVAEDLGIAGTGNGTLAGSSILAGINTVMVSSLSGGTGLNLGSIKITNSAGASATVDLSGARTVNDILDAISGAGINVKGTVSTAGNGIQVIDSADGIGLLKIEESGGTTAAELGLLGTAATGATAIQGKNLQRQWMSPNTLLADLNGGKGVTSGRFRVTNSNGAAMTIDLSTGTKFTLGDVMRDINARGLGVTASINVNGDGLLLTDSAGGGLKMKVENVDGTSATDLNIEGTATTTTIDGSFEKTIAVTATDTLATVQKKLSDLNFGVNAQIISDGSQTAPFRLSLTAKNSGRDGRVLIDAGTTSLATRNLVEAQDAAVFLGSAGGAEPLLITSGSNQITGVIKGVTIDLHGTSAAPVSLNVTRDADSMVEQTSKFVENFNGLVDKIKELTKFDTDTREKGLMLGDSTVRTVEASVYTMLSTVVKTAGKYRLLADVGLKLGGGAKLEFDEDKFREAYATDPDSVQKLFTMTDIGVGAKVESVASKLVDPVNGVITRENKTLDAKTQQFQDRIIALDKLLEQKRSRLERQFASMETVLANLQSQQSSLTQLANLASSSS